MLDAKPYPGCALLQAQSQVAPKRCEFGLGNGVYRGLVLPVVQVGALDVIARHRRPRQGLDQKQEQENKLFHQMRIKLQGRFEFRLPRCGRHLPFVAHPRPFFYMQEYLKKIKISVLRLEKY